MCGAFLSITSTVGTTEILYLVYSSKAELHPNGFCKVISDVWVVI